MTEIDPSLLRDLVNLIHLGKSLDSPSFLDSIEFSEEFFRVDIFFKYSVQNTKI